MFIFLAEYSLDPTRKEGVKCRFDQCPEVKWSMKVLIKHFTKDHDSPALEVDEGDKVTLTCGLEEIGELNYSSPISSRSFE